MAEENTNTDVGQVDDGQIDDNGQTDDGQVDISKQSDADFMSDTVKDIKEKQAAILGDEVATEDSSDTSDSGSNEDVLKDLAGTDIPDAFSAAAEAAGISPEDIIAMADKHTDEQLLEMIPALEASLKSSDDEDKAAKQDDKKTDGADNKDDKDIEKEAELAERIAKQVEEKLGVSLKEIEEFKAYQEEQSTKNTVDRASELFDKASENFPIFGKTEELPRFPSGRLEGQLIPTSPEMKARLEVLGYADAFIGKDSNIDDAMEKGLATYAGLHLEKELERKQVRDLKRHEVKLSGARVGKETKKKYADSRDEIIDDIRQMQRQAGVD